MKSLLSNKQGRQWDGKEGGGCIIEHLLDVLSQALYKPYLIDFSNSPTTFLHSISH